MMALYSIAVLTLIDSCETPVLAPQDFDVTAAECGNEERPNAAAEVVLPIDREDVFHGSTLPRNFTPGSSPSVNVTPAASRAVRMADRVRG